MIRFYIILINLFCLWHNPFLYPIKKRLPPEVKYNLGAFLWKEKSNAISNLKGNEN